MANAVLTVLSMTIGFFFILMGTLKLSPAINDEVYKEMRKTFIKSAKVFPFVEQTEWKPNPHTYRKVIGVTETVCGVILGVVPGTLKEGANVVLLGIMFGAVYTHYALGEGMDRMTPALIFGLLLACRLVVHYQVRSREARYARQAAMIQAAELKAAEMKAAEKKSE